MHGDDGRTKAPREKGWVTSDSGLDYSKVEEWVDSELGKAEIESQTRLEGRGDDSVIGGMSRVSLDMRGNMGSGESTLGTRKAATKVDDLNDLGEDRIKRRRWGKDKEYR